MPPINETEAQRKARLNPTAITVQTPTNSGFFRAVGDYGTAIYKMNPDGRTYQAYDILNELGGGGASGNAGGQAGVAKQTLQSKYGIDFNALPQQNLGDLLYSGKSANGNPFTDRATPVRGSLTDLFTVAPPATFGTQTINNTPNTLVTPLANPAQAINPLLQLQKGETIDQYFARTNALNPNYADKATPTSTINSSITGGATPVNFQTSPTTYPTFDTSKLPSDVSIPQETLTQPQTDLQKQINEIMGLNTQEAGKQAYQNEQSAARDITGLTRLQNDLSAQLKMKQLEAADIQQRQQTGEGVTTAIDQRQRQEALRLNNVESLNIYARLEMAKGNLQTAQDAVDRAVQIKFDPIEADIKARTANINLILQSPEYTVAEKNQAAKIKATFDAQTRAIEQQKSIVSENNKLKGDVLNAAQASGDNALAAKIIQLSPESPTFSADLASLQGQINSNVWSEPYLVGGDYVQKNSLTGEIRTAVNVPVGGAGGGENETTNFIDVMQATIDAGGSPEQAAREAATVSEASGVQVDQKTLNAWTAAARKLKKASPQTETNTPAPTPVITAANLNQYKVENGKLVPNPDYKPPQAGLRAGTMNPVTSFIDSISNFLFK